MNKVIVLSAVLGLSALGMACGDSGNNTNVTVKPANTPVSVSTPAPVSTPAMTPASNMTNSPMKGTNSPTTKTNMASPAPTKKM